MKKKLNKENLFMIVLVTALIGIFVILFTYGLDSVLAMEGNMPPNILTEGETPAPTDKAEAVDYLNKIITKAENDKPKFENYKHFDLNSDTLNTTASEQAKSIFKYAVPEFVSQLNSGFETTSGDFGEEIGNKINLPKISAEDVTDFKCEYIYYSCPSCGAEKEEALPNCEDCGGVNPYNMKYRDEYTVTLTVAVNEKNLSDNFNKRTKEDAVALCGDTFYTFAELKKLDIAYNELKIVYRANRLTDSITFLEYSKKMKIDADTELLDKYSALGEISTDFELTEYDGYNFTWPGLALSESEVTVEPKGNGNLLAELTCSDPLTASVTWSSSDESIITVDSEGYYDAGDTAGEAKIIASFEFNGQTYTNECLVKVKYSVESSKMNKKSVELSVGDTKQLSVTVKPSNATVKTVKWYSENPNIAEVDENGVVTAVSSGVVTVYSLTDDGYFKSSCEVTVK